MKTDIICYFCRTSYSVKKLVKGKNCLYLYCQNCPDTGSMSIYDRKTYDLLKFDLYIAHVIETSSVIISLDFRTGEFLFDLYFDRDGIRNKVDLFSSQEAERLKLSKHIYRDRLISLMNLRIFS